MALIEGSAVSHLLHVQDVPDELLVVEHVTRAAGVVELSYRNENGPDRVHLDVVPALLDW